VAGKVTVHVGLASHMATVACRPAYVATLPRPVYESFWTSREVCEKSHIILRFAEPWSPCIYVACYEESMIELSFSSTPLGFVFQAAPVSYTQLSCCRGTARRRDSLGSNLSSVG